jgi:hypothetical protein
MKKTRKQQRVGPRSNKISVPFNKAVDILLSTPPKKKLGRKKKPSK